MNQVPTDSVLKRHYAQQRQAGNAPAGAACGGLFGWLKKLFCR